MGGAVVKGMCSLTLSPNDSKALGGLELNHARPSELNEIHAVNFYLKGSRPIDSPISGKSHHTNQPKDRCLTMYSPQFQVA